MLDGLARAAFRAANHAHASSRQRPEPARAACRPDGGRQDDYLRGLRVSHHVQFHKTAFHPAFFARPLAPVVQPEPARAYRGILERFGSDTVIILPWRVLTSGFLVHLRSWPKEEVRDPQFVLPMAT